MNYFMEDFGYHKKKKDEEDAKTGGFLGCCREKKEMTQKQGYGEREKVTQK